MNEPPAPPDTDSWEALESALAELRRAARRLMFRHRWRNVRYVLRRRSRT